MITLELEDTILISVGNKMVFLPLQTVIDQHFPIIMDMIEGGEVELSDSAYGYYNAKYDLIVNQ